MNPSIKQLLNNPDESNKLIGIYLALNEGYSKHKIFDELNLEIKFKRVHHLVQRYSYHFGEYVLQVSAYQDDYIHDKLDYVRFDIQHSKRCISMFNITADIGEKSMTSIINDFKEKFIDVLIDITGLGN